MPMKLYEVELKRTSYTTYVVQAMDEDEAEEEAWKLLARGGGDNGDADWEVSSVSNYEP